MANQMQLGFFLTGNPKATRTFTEKKQQSRVLSTLFLMSSLTWITQKDLERVIKNKGDKFRSKKDKNIS